MFIRVFIWKKAPFLRLLLPFIMGITLQWHLQLPVQISWYVFGFSVLALSFSFSLSNFVRYKIAITDGIYVILIFIAFGSLFTWYKDIRHNPDWYGNHYKRGDLLFITLREAPAEKANSYKAVATVTGLKGTTKFIHSKGGIVLYFQKDSSLSKLRFGEQIIFSKELQEIKNAGNPAGFDYKRYSLFQGITHQAYLKRTEFIVLNKNKQTFYGKFVFPIRDKVIAIMRRYIHGKKEQGLAEALLIGYKDDLDKNLVQSYSNTGVVHIIAISGLHLGLIYWLLVQLLRPLGKKKVFKWVCPIIVITGLWLFTLIAGGQPSVLRSAVMFTCIVLAQAFSRKTSIYNTLALSAFILLCMNPYWLWDVGFQLSYAAVLSIVIFMKPIYNWFYIRNKALDFAWKLNAVSIAAQLLTTPFGIYHFHQFPNFFLFTNFVAVPLSSIILLGEIFLCVISFIPILADFSGKILSWLIWLMNSYIERIEALPCSLWGELQINITQAALLTLVVAGLGYWLLERQKMGAWAGVSALLFFSLFRSYSFYQSNQQKKLVVYNISRHLAIDIMDGRNCYLNADPDLHGDDFAINFHIKPSRIFYRVKPLNPSSNFPRQPEIFLHYGTKRILMIDTDVFFDSCTTKIPIDVLIISKSPKLYLLKLFNTFNFRQVVFDSSVPAWRLKYWKEDCDSLHIPYHDVKEKGAFVMNLN